MASGRTRPPTICMAPSVELWQPEASHMGNIVSNLKAVYCGDNRPNEQGCRDTVSKASYATIISRRHKKPPYGTLISGEKIVMAGYLDLQWSQNPALRFRGCSPSASARVTEEGRQGAQRNNPSGSGLQGVQTKTGGHLKRTWMQTFLPPLRRRSSTTPGKWH
jgi:hypothetical protein